MMADTHVFSFATQSFSNVRNSGLKRHCLESAPIASFMKASSQLFKILDRSDFVQAEVARKLWVLRSSILFTLLPFDDASLNLERQMSELMLASRGLPETANVLEILSNAILNLLKIERNPKMELVLRIIEESGISNAGSVGLLSALSTGKPPGWPPLEQSKILNQLAEKLSLIRSRGDLKAGEYWTVILPCACRNTSQELLSELLYSGRSARFDVLLYPGEYFLIPKRCVLPDDGIFQGRRQSTVIDQEKYEISDEGPIATVDTWINEAFWQGLHGGARNGGADLVSANYVLFGDGTGAFLPENGHVTALPADGVLVDEGDLRVIRVADVVDGDLIALRSGESGLLLDEAADRIMNTSGDVSLYDRATDWKEALEALLISHTCEEVSRALERRGVKATANSIRQWSGPDVLGPGNEQVFKSLIALLVENGKISPPGEDLTGYAESRWSSLHNFRSVRQKAGNQIRQDLFKVLIDRFGRKGNRLGERESVHIDGDTGVELLILRVSALDRSPAYVHQSRLGRLDNLKDNKWLG